MSFVSNVGGNLASSLLGNPKKAFLVIHKKPEDEVRDVALKTESALELLNAAGNISGKAISDTFGGAANSHVLQVQYNPSSISFQANSSPVPMQRLQQNIATEIPAQFSRPPSVVMSVQLIFDAVNVKDSFMFEKFRVSLNDAVSSVASIVNRSSYTVQPQTNALLAMLMREETSLVTFHWSNMTFHGEVNEVQAKYVMFSVSGRPVRSTVQFNIKQVVQSKGESKYWDNAFTKCFCEDGGSKDSGKMDIGQYVGNLLNFGF